MGDCGYGAEGGLCVSRMTINVFVCNLFYRPMVFIVCSLVLLGVPEMFQRSVSSKLFS